ncbi:endocuticle structural glycoprotein SgAbd-5-like [Achroia grisella]|uniref:endocuticle structural glycoprotein SgAbd-5-like n=1 Tax=Achroia grisella TaxID=688607 RepID=UPI0027D29ECE|nr:endocuticle structural glycoprotein SgAbd-5-like [Achroia grisella]
MYKLVAVFFAAMIGSLVAQQADIVRYENDNTGLGNFRYFFEQTDGTRHEQIGELRNAGTENAYVVLRGFYSYVAPDGVLRVVKYVADENGYQPEEGEGPGALPPSAAASLLG